jgi:predicted site-specific integrase-resolvase
VSVAAARRDGISVTTLRRIIRDGEVDQVVLGRDVKVWRDEQVDA